MAERVDVTLSDWDADELARLGEALGFANGRSRYIGGWVRDRLAGRAPGDLDIGTQMLPHEAKQRAEAAGLTVWSSPSGIAHGTVGVVVGGQGVEVTTLRRDVSTDGRRATVAFTEDWREDAARRDFTINALSADPLSGEVHDYFGGVEDLRAGRVRFIGDARQRIAEDHLRILRFFRFHARYGRGAPDAEAYDVCAERANDLMALSRERIADELLKLLASEDPAPAVALMLDRDILKPVLPEIGRDGLARLVRLTQAEQGKGDSIRRLAALLPQEPAVADGVAARLRLSNAQRKRIVAVLDGPADPGRPRALAARVGREAAIDRLLLVGESAAAAELADWDVPALPVGGQAMLALDLRGPEIAEALKVVRERWVDEDFPDEARVGAIAQQVAAGILARRKSSASDSSSGRA